MNFTFKTHPLVIAQTALLDLCVSEPQQQYVLQTLVRMMTEIVSDVRADRVPSTVSSFGDLHDYVDANEYGGFCEESEGAALKGIDLGNSLFPTRELKADGTPEDTLQTQEFMVVADLMQTAISNWIADGGIQAHMNANP